MLEEFLKLEKKVNILAEYCRELKEENLRLKEMLSKNETDMYSLIEEKDTLAKEKTELSKKIVEIETDNNRISNLINTIDSAMEGYECVNTNKQEISKEDKTEKNIIENVIENETEHKEKTTVTIKEINNKEIKNDNTNIEAENKTTITPSLGNVHIKEDEDPFSKANDNDWDKDIENDITEDIELGDDELEDIEIEEKQNTENESKKEIIKEIANDDYDFEIQDDDDGYVFSDDDDDEESGFIFEDENK